MTILRQKIEQELDAMDNQSMAAVYEHLRQMNRLQRTSRKRRIAAAGAGFDLILGEQLG